MDDLKAAVQTLIQYGERHAWKGYDPYDGLNASFAQAWPFRRRTARLLITQGFKRCPVNLRPLAGIQPEWNPKGLALIASALMRLSGTLQVEAYRTQALALLDRVLDMASRGYAGACWGYPFDWQSRALFAPRGTPNLVTTVFVARAFLDAHDLTNEGRYAEVARSACDFIMKNLHHSPVRDMVCVSYTPLDHTQVHNANLLGAWLLARVGRLTGEASLSTLAAEAVAFALHHQREDGSWYYGPAPHHHWIDHFHTGFNLEALQDYADWTGRGDVARRVRDGLAFYLANLFTDFTGASKGNIPKYYHDRLYPVDIHSCAQAIIVLTKLGRLEPGLFGRAMAVARWTLAHLRDPEGFFYFQRTRWWTNRIPYMRWSQAWMLRAMAELLAARSQA